MEDRIRKEKGDRDVASIISLNLRCCRSSNVAGLSEDWKKLEYLTISNSGLSSLKGFPRLPSLKRLELYNNNLSEGIDALACLPKLEYLDLSDNKIKDIETLKPLAQVSTLKTLRLAGGYICQEERYREKVFEVIPSLINLDGKSKEDEEKNGVESENEEYESLSEEENSLDEEEEEEEEEDLDEEVGYEKDIPLEALYRKYDDVGDDDDDFEAGEEEEDEDIDEEDEEVDSSVNISQTNSEETEEVRGKKRKHEDDH